MKRYIAIAVEETLLVIDRALLAVGLGHLGWALLASRLGCWADEARHGTVGA